MRQIIFIFVSVLMLAPAEISAQDVANKLEKVYPFPTLNYSYDALEPHIDALTMSIHYERHYKAYYNNFLKAIEGTALEGKPIREVLSAVSTLEPAVRNNGGGYYNHTLFWENLSPKGGAPTVELQKEIEKQFGSLAEFKKAFVNAATTVFGSGWAWLVLSQDNKLQIVTTPNQDSPVMDVAAVKGEPLLALDVWEHAYYLKYQNKRADYIESFWKVIDWNCVSQRYRNAKK